MTTTASCPPPGRLKDLLDGNLSATDQAAVSSHLETCVACQKTLEGLVAGAQSWEGAARHLAEQDAAAGPELHRLVSDLKAAGSDADTSASHELNEPPPLDFLSPADKPGLLGKLGQYEVLAVVGRGGMGVVLKAFHPALHRVVAIKVLAPQLATSANARRRFTREAVAAAAVSHDHVVSIHAVEETAGLPYLVMPYISGVSLQELLDRQGPLETKEILRIGMQVAAGLAAAHAQGLVHRDIKPANILLENGVQRVKITDFGLARTVDDATLTQSGVLAGTPQYMAPEQARGDAVDSRADLFSLGSVLYAPCTGRSPFRASTTMGVIKRVCEERARPIREINPDIPLWLTEIIDKLHAKDRAQRFQSAREVAELLEQHLAHLQQPSLVSQPARVTGPDVIPAARGALPASLAPPTPLWVGMLLLAMFPLALYVLRGWGLVSTEALRTIIPIVVGLLIVGLAWLAPWAVRVAWHTNVSRTAIGAMIVLAALAVVALAIQWWTGELAEVWPIDLAVAAVVGVVVAAYAIGGRSRGTAVVVACAALLAVVCLGAAGVWLYQQTDWALGHVKFEFEDPTMMVVTTDASRRAATTYPGTESNFHADRPGKYTWQAYKNGLVVHAGSFELSAGQSIVVRITATPPKAQFGSLRTIKAFTASDPLNPHPRSSETIVPDQGGWRIEPSTKIENRLRTVQFFEVADLDLEGGQLIFRAQLKVKDLPGRALLQMESDQDHNEPFDAAYLAEQRQAPLTGTTDWQPVEASFFLGNGPAPRRVRLNVLIQGKNLGATVWIKNVELLHAERAPSAKTADSTSASQSSADPLLVLQYPLAGHLGWASSVAYSPDGNLLASGSNGVINLWDPATGQLLGALSDHEKLIWALAFSPDGKRLASGSHDTKIKIWDVAAKLRLTTVEAHASRVWTLAFSPDGQTLASGSEDKGLQVKLNDTSDSRLRQSLPHSGHVRSLAYSPDGTRLAAALSWIRGVQLWDSATGKDRGTLSGHQGPVTSVCFTPDGGTLITGSQDKTIGLWDLATNTLRRSLTGHQQLIEAVALSPNGRLLASVSGNYQAPDQVGEIFVWDAKSGQQLATLSQAGPVFSVAFSPDGSQLATGNADGTVRLWRVTAFAGPPTALAPFSSDQAKRYRDCWSEYLGVPREVENSQGTRLALIPPGAFVMGASDEEVSMLSNENVLPEDWWFRDFVKERVYRELPRHPVEISKPFYLGMHEITLREFRKFVEDQHYQTDAERESPGGYGWHDGRWVQAPEFNWRNVGFEQGNNHPVGNLSWHDAVAYCRWLSQREGAVYRVPTEAEWEYACRAGSTTWFHSGDADTLQKVANLADAALARKHADCTWPQPWDDGYAYTAPVGRFQPNAFGLFDMHGNVWEWCADRYDRGYYRNSPASDPLSGSSPSDNGLSAGGASPVQNFGSPRIFRGGGWDNYPGFCRSADRYSSHSPTLRTEWAGFRIVREVPADSNSARSGQ